MTDLFTSQLALLPRISGVCVKLHAKKNGDWILYFFCSISVTLEGAEKVLITLMMKMPFQNKSD